ncbi:MAG TPA: ferredoxin--NADP reductase [Amaricoccus sp.]|uniref:ferredoxin--NADP reductase n=1 Tax=Amaricoccus sp. TaxID=1872485 RepID=UPI001DACB49C|nr:ferredoxin--NADP reductase [Amaricoccus sp.]MCB1376108.1 ferredoxin--NADP reductase [Paracoccaceae bacterium]HPG21460.1 ferredoxin--NADP reductase [Amaricoccus sp.]HRW15014.1 ferredoxin--NADP reductase [Amaricoccus sp.]
MDQVVDKALRGMTLLKVRNIRHWTDKTFSFNCDRPAAFRFRSGEFVMIGLMVEGKPLVRAYSICSPSWDEELEFYSIKVADGPLTSRLQHLREGDEIVMRPKPVGTLVHDALLPGRRLFLFSTGTGIAPFASIIRDPETYEKFDRVVLTHTCRELAELGFGKDLIQRIAGDEILSEMVGDKLTLISTTTREASPHTGRMTDWIRDGRLAEAVGGALDPATDRVMICGSMAMLQDHKALCEAAGFTEGSNSEPGQFVIEKAFVD